MSSIGCRLVNHTILMPTLSNTNTVPPNPFGFDPTYGYTLDSLLRVPCPPPPDDFADFWRDTYRQANEIPPQPTWREVGRSAGQIIYEVEFDGWNLRRNPPFRVGGWITVPATGPVRSGVVVGHGYGGRDGPDAVPPLAEAAAIYPCARGFGRSARDDLPNQSDAHVLHGIAHRETYLHRFCVTDIWAAARALVELVPETAQWLTYSGASFGGGIGALALPWEPLFRRAFLDFPSFGQYPIRLTLTCVGSGEAVRHAGGLAHLPMLRYFDAATAAGFTQIPTLVAAALYDPAVAPPGQFAVYNCFSGKKELFVRRAAHFEHPDSVEEDNRLRPIVADWLACQVPEG